MGPKQDQLKNPSRGEGELKERTEILWHEERIPSSKVKSSLRWEYFAQALRIREQWGGLRAIQSRLGLNQRQMSRLFMVDPSMMSRWLQNEEQVPPYIWRSLEWYLLLQKKEAGLNPHFFTAQNSIDRHRSKPPHWLWFLHGGLIVLQVAWALVVN